MLLNLDKFEKIYLYRPFADFRKGIFGLSALVQDQMELNPFSRYLFLFCNRSRDKIKVLYWDETGFALWYKVLEKDKFSWPSHFDQDAIGVELERMQQFLRGLNPWQVGHQKLNYKKV
jgi:transposase